MSKAEERAYEAYPKMSRITEPHGVIPDDYESHYIGDANEEKRMGFIKGYQQAEKDLELTVDDIMKLDALLIEMWNRPSNEDKYQEILKRFNKERKEK